MRVRVGGQGLRTRRSWQSICAALALSWTTGSEFIQAQEDPFAAGVRATPHLSAADERAALHVPDGFTIQLFASEPQIAKPLNMAFDQRGRLWITDTLEYPYAVPADQPGRDSVKILEDSDGDGRADKVTTFADGLNIPIGILPWKQGAIVFSIPNIWYLADTDGDGRCDQRTRLYGPFGHDRDTHGLNNAFRHGWDGWIYACHGFNNQSEVAGTDGHQVILNSGNTYRFSPDGHHIEHYTHGQVNPFGMALDPLGNIFTADCHSKPVYELLRGGYYPSFRKPDDGLGFVPPIMEHLHGSTAISGLAIADVNFPAEYQGNLLSGNVMTSRVNRNSLAHHGSTARAIEQADFVVSDDPWFRPVDLQIAPDGSLFVADFYNRIIGHYEVPLEHPGRDRASGRIWRIVPAADVKRPPLTPLEQLSLEDLIEQLEAPVFTRRMQAMHYLVEHHPDQVVAPLQQAIRRAGASPQLRSHGLWILHRLNQLDDALRETLARDDTAAVRVHALKELAETSTWNDRHRQLAVNGLSDPDPLVRRAAADALGQHPQADQVPQLLAALAQTDVADIHLRHVLRMALRNHLAVATICDQVAASSLSPSEQQLVSDVLPAVRNASAARLITDRMLAGQISPEQLPAALNHVCRYGDAEQLNPWLDRLAESTEIPVDQQLLMLGEVRQAFRQSGRPLPDRAVRWAARLAAGYLARATAVTDRPLAWQARPFDPAVATTTPTPLLPTGPHHCQDGQNEAPFWDSILLGETATGRWQSEPFTAPRTISFFLAGHRGDPSDEAHTLTRVELHDAVRGTTLATAYPPRNDVAQPVTWDLAASAGQEVTISIVDGDAGTAYAWLAAGRFSVEGLNPSSTTADLQLAALLIGEFQLREFAGQLESLLSEGRFGRPSLGQLAQTYAQLKGDWRRDVAAVAWQISSLTDADLARLTKVLIEPTPEGFDPLLIEILQRAAAADRQLVAQRLVAHQEGQQRLVELIQRGVTPATLLQLASIQGALNGATADVKQEVERLRATLPAESPELETDLQQRIAHYRQGTGERRLGQAVFAKHCAACHQRAGQGAVIGPQLDGIGKRGLERVAEDILAPSRNVDVAFRTSTVITHDGRVLSGLVQAIPDQPAVKIVNQQGQSETIPQSEIAEQHPSQLSLMPDQFARQLSTDDFAHLLAFLLSD
ncbi:MAG: PVC-type heme-binding CxxCH protein [Pirellulales bacterium]